MPLIYVSDYLPVKRGSIPPAKAIRALRKDPIVANRIALLDRLGKDDRVKPTVTIHPAAGERVLRAFGEEVHLYLTGGETGGRFAQWLEVTPPGGGPPPHSHENEDEWFHVLEGRVSFLSAGEWTEVGPGARVHCPKGSVHTFKNTGETPSRMLLTTMPSGFEDFFARCAAEFANPAGPDMPRVLEIAAEHGIHFVGP